LDLCRSDNFSVLVSRNKITGHHKAAKFVFHQSIGPDGLTGVTTSDFFEQPYRLTAIASAENNLFIRDKVKV
jgi:hypothetical protein